MKKVQATKDLKFIILFGDKIYKFLVESNEIRNKWVESLNKEIKKLTTDDEDKKYENVAELKLKKKVIEDFFNLPKIQEGKDYIIKITEEAIITEGFFKLKPKK